MKVPREYTLPSLVLYSLLVWLVGVALAIGWLLWV